MKVEMLDHVNIVTDRLEETAAFYAEVLGLERRSGPPPSSDDLVRWMYDGEGRAVLHLNAVECARAHDRHFEPGADTGAVHHVALRCHGYDETLDRLRTRGLDYETALVESIGLRQIFTFDPNKVLLELNFFGD